MQFDHTYYNVYEKIILYYYTEFYMILINPGIKVSVFSRVLFKLLFELIDHCRVAMGCKSIQSADYLKIVLLLRWINTEEL